MSLNLFACGDVVNCTDNKLWICDSLKKIIQSSDYAICNFEAPIFTDGMKKIPKAGPHVYQHKNSVKYIANAGFTHVSLANNHIYDYGESAIKHTMLELSENGIFFIGAGETFDQAYAFHIIEKNGIKIGLLAACENEFGCYYEDILERSGYAWLFHPQLEDQIAQLKKNVDYIILIAHAGVENIPIPIKEWRDRYKRLCDLGVDVVIGHHPHVPQGFEDYNSSLIFYSLGNFYFDTKSFINLPDDSYSVYLSFTKKSIDFKLIFHKKINHKTTILEKNKSTFSIEKLNSLLADNYLETNNKYALKTYDEYYKNYYFYAIGGFIGLIGWAKKILHKLVRRNHENSQGLLLLHNIRIDSHRFIVQRALSLKYEKK
jgi:hypothetical protein